jgi:Zn-dependent protease/predicted transcriptional regulator
MNTSIHLGKPFGIPVGINYSWAIVFLLFTYMLYDLFSQEYPSWPLLQRWILAITTTILLFLSVLVHEFSHSIIAIRMGIPIRGITLFIFGGVSQMAHEPRRPYTEFLVAVVGPLTSLVLASVCGGLWWILQNAQDSISAIFGTLFGINLSLAIMNMLPGFPLDGGRVLRAAVWGATGNYLRATLVAARAGQVIGISLVIGGICLAIMVTGFQSLWMAFIGIFLFAAATSNYREELSNQSLIPLSITDIMITKWSQLPSVTLLNSTSVTEGLSGRADFLIVLLNDQITGIVTRHQIARVSRLAQTRTQLGEIMLPLLNVPSISPQDEIYNVLDRLESENINYLAVRVEGALMGFISLEESLRLIPIRSPSMP